MKMNTCGFSKMLLQSFYDGEAGVERQSVEDHISACAECRAQLDDFKTLSQRVSRDIDAALGETDTLMAIHQIRQKIALRESSSLKKKWWALDTWVLGSRQAVHSMAVAAALGALVAPLVYYGMGWNQLSEDLPAVTVASVVVESMEVGGSAKAMVFGSDGSTTLIWVEPDSNLNPEVP